MDGSNRACRPSILELDQCVGKDTVIEVDTIDYPPTPEKELVKWRSLMGPIVSGSSLNERQVVYFGARIEDSVPPSPLADISAFILFREANISPETLARVVANDRLPLIVRQAAALNLRSRVSDLDGWFREHYPGSVKTRAAVTTIISAIEQGAPASLTLPHATEISDEAAAE